MAYSRYGWRKRRGDSVYAIRKAEAPSADSSAVCRREREVRRAYGFSAEGAEVRRERAGRVVRERVMDWPCCGGGVGKC